MVELQKVATLGIAVGDLARPIGDRYNSLISGAADYRESCGETVRFCAVPAAARVFLFNLYCSAKGTAKSIATITLSQHLVLRNWIVIDYALVIIFEVNFWLRLDPNIFKEILCPFKEFEIRSRSGKRQVRG